MTKTLKVMTQLWQYEFAFKGITLTELLAGVVTGSIVLTLTASGFINLLKKNHSIESKTIRHGGLIKALAYLQEDMKGAKFLTAQQATPSGECATSSIDSDYCLVLTYPENTPLRAGCTGVNRQIYYGFEDISSGTQIWLKPGILKRKIICGSSAGNWIVIADGLLGKKEDNPITNFSNPRDFCLQNSVNWTGDVRVYGGDRTSENKGGFRFCLQDGMNPNNRLVRVFLYGHIINGKPINVHTITFARSE